MKKKYLTPEVDINLLKLEDNFLTSERQTAPPDAKLNLVFDDEVDPW